MPGVATVEALPEELDVDGADVRCWISEHLELDLHDDVLLNDLVLEVRPVFSPTGERAMPVRAHELTRAYRLFGATAEGPRCSTSSTPRGSGSSRARSYWSGCCRRSRAGRTPRGSTPGSPAGHRRTC